MPRRENTLSWRFPGGSGGLGVLWGQHVSGNKKQDWAGGEAELGRGHKQGFGQPLGSLEQGNLQGSG